METLRKVAQFRLNKGSLQADGLYNITNDILLRYTEKEGCSLWFDEDRKDELMAMDEYEFLKVAKKAAGNNLYTKEVLSTLWSEITTHIRNGKLTQKYKTGLGRTFYQGDTLEEIKEWLELHFKMPINYAYK